MSFSIKVQPICPYTGFFIRTGAIAPVDFGTKSQIAPVNLRIDLMAFRINFETVLGLQGELLVSSNRETVAEGKKVAENLQQWP